MRRLRDNLNELFHLCGVNAEPVDIRHTKWLLRRLAELIPDKVLYKYLEDLDTQTEFAVQAMKVKHLDEWDRQQTNQQNEERISELEQALKQAQKDLEQKQVQAQEAQEKLTRELQEEKERVESYCEEQLSVVKNLIALRDKLLIRKSFLEDQAPEEKNAQKLVISQLRETGRCLTNMGVEILEEAGAFDERYQTVVDTCPAASEELAGQISETLRPGYRFQDEVLRPQEVILFVEA